MEFTGGSDNSNIRTVDQDYRSGSVELREKSVYEEENTPHFLDIMVLSFRINELLSKQALTEYKENVVEMDKLSRKVRKINAQAARMSEKDWAAGVYFDKDGNLISNYDVNGEGYKSLDELLADNGGVLTGTTTIDGLSGPDDISDNNNSGDVNIPINISIEWEIKRNAEGDIVFSYRAEIFWEGINYAGLDSLPMIIYPPNTINDDGEEQKNYEEKVIKKQTSFTSLLRKILSELSLEIKKNADEWIKSSFSNDVIQQHEAFSEGNDGEKQAARFADKSIDALLDDLVSGLGDAHLDNKLATGIFRDIDELYGEGASIGLDSAFNVSSVDELYDSNSAGLKEGHQVLEFDIYGLKHVVNVYWEFTDEGSLSYTFDLHVQHDKTIESSVNTYTYEGTYNTEAGKQFGGDTIPVSELGSASTKDIWYIIYGQISAELSDEFTKVAYGLKNNENPPDWFMQLYDLRWVNAMGRAGVGERNRLQSRNPEVQRSLLGFYEDSPTKADWFERNGNEDTGMLNRVLPALIDIAFTEVGEVDDLGLATNASSENNNLALNPNDFGAWLEEQIGEPAIYQNGMGFTSHAQVTTVTDSINDVVAHLGHMNNLVLSRIRRFQETASQYLNLIVQALQREYQSLNAISNNMG